MSKLPGIRSALRNWHRSGLISFAAVLDESIETIEAQCFYRNFEPELAMAHRANKKERTKAFHSRIAYHSKNYLHKLSTEIVRDYRCICMGNVNGNHLAHAYIATSVVNVAGAYSGIGALLEELRSAHITKNRTALFLSGRQRLGSTDGTERLARICNLRMDWLKLWDSALM